MSPSKIGPAAICELLPPAALEVVNLSTPPVRTGVRTEQPCSWDQ